MAETRSMTLLEREPALEALTAALAEATAGEGCVALVYGEAGIGKTALVRGLEPAGVVRGAPSRLALTRGA
jgi:tRNA A37 threonylcarbamoyladenosine biosynthesis protein TsaE